jgi:hypothetical protein
MGGVVNRAGGWKIFKSITFSRGAGWAMMRMRISSPCASDAISNSTCEGWFNSPARLGCSFLMLSGENVSQELSASFSLKVLLHDR